MTPAGDRSASVHVLKVALRDVRPAVWRRLEVPSSMSLAELHEVLQVAFDWSDDHLHDFRSRGVRYVPGHLQEFGLPFGEPPRDEGGARLGRVVPRPGDVLEYVYDFGDDWRHSLLVESVGAARPDAAYPVCTAGSGLPPEEDLGGPRPGRFGEEALRSINRRLRQVPGCYLASDDGLADPYFAGLFPDLDLDLALDGGGMCPCGCGETVPPAEQMPLPVLHPAPDGELAALAVASPLVRRALALATWVGSGRALTPSLLLRPADAVRAVAELGLAEGVLFDDHSADPSAEEGVVTAAEGRAGRSAGDTAGVLTLFGDDDEPPQRPTQARRVRSAKDLPSLHPLWTGCVGAGLIDVRGGKAYPGPGLAAWQEPADVGARLGGWCALLSGYLRAHDDAVRERRDVESRLRARVLPVGVPLLYALAREPVPVAALSLATADLDEFADLLGSSPVDRLPAAAREVRHALEIWAVAGIVDRGTVSVEIMATLREQLAGMRAGVEEHDALMAAGPAGPEHAAALRAELTAVLDGLLEGPAVRLTSLGGYGLARLLAAHGWHVPEAGACAGCAPGALLDELGRYVPEDVAEEASAWLHAQGDHPEAALREVLHSAASRGEEGPGRRSVLPLVLAAAGERAVPAMNAVRGDPWLTPILAVVRYGLGAGPEPTLADLMWLAVDMLGRALGDEEWFADEFADSPLAEMLAQPGAVAVAAGLRHPRARDVLRAAAPLLADPQLGQALRKALAGRSGNPAQRGGSRRDRGRGARTRR